MLITSAGPTRKRGPPKGFVDTPPPHPFVESSFATSRYLHTVERRLHEVQAVLGIILAHPGPQVQSLISELCRDDYAATIIARVNQSAFGPAGRKPDASPSPESDPHSPDRESSFAGGDPDPFIAGPTNAWQDRVLGVLRQQYGGKTAQGHRTRVKTGPDIRRPLLTSIRPVLSHSIPNTPSASTPSSDLISQRISLSPVSPMVSPSDPFPKTFQNLAVIETNSRMSSVSDSSTSVATPTHCSPGIVGHNWTQQPVAAVTPMHSSIEAGGLQLYTFDKDSMNLQLHNSPTPGTYDGTGLSDPAAFFQQGYDSGIGWWPGTCEP
ncbi:hypothetical protein SISNIDRAFT_460793 [Sistotremastrum niveocremeum HHB9708]|uniref:Uncharacterized protein n=1 Tax=Sistotremastrum niveocremeum HHB9708 TaxID=1314777 RepID=A0A164NA21_9AGAM|nr:hypothetical protein SISNIDRAFT_460793 [Sistotremastrum niveocremeum HHB9708]